MNDETVVGKVGKFNIAFRPRRQSSHARAVLMQQLIKQLGVAMILDEEIKVKERERGFGESVYLLAVVWNLILGGECVDDLNVLRGDPGTLLLIEMERLPTPRATGKFLRRFQSCVVQVLGLAGTIPLGDDQDTAASLVQSIGQNRYYKPSNFPRNF